MAMYLLQNDTVELMRRLTCSTVFVFVYKATLNYRNKFTPVPATSCDKGCYPLCSGNTVHQLRLLKELENRVGLHAPLYEYAVQLFENPNEPFVMKSDG